MTHEESKKYFSRFKDIVEARHADGYIRAERPSKEEATALRFYMAERGCISENGKYYQWWEVCDGKAVKAKVGVEGFINADSIIRRHGCTYHKGHNKEEALKESQRMKNEVYTLRGNVKDVQEEVSGDTKSGGRWRRKIFCVDIVGSGGKEAAFTLQNENIDTFQPNIGDLVEIEFSPESRKSNDRYYTDLKVTGFNVLFAANR